MRRIKELVLALPLALVLAGTSFAVVTPPSPIDLVVEQVNVTMPDATVVPMWKMRLAADPPGTPLPVISAAAGDTLTINVTNTLTGEPVSLVINGQAATEANAMVPTWTDNTTGPRTGVAQRVRSFTHEAAPNGGTATYTWASLRAGTYLITSGTHPGVQVPMGLYAALKVDAAPGQAYGPSTAYAGEAVLLFSEIDPALNNAVASGDYGNPAGPYPTALNMHYTPKYFLINGAPFTTGTPAMLVAGAGQRTLLRLLNAGLWTRVPVIQNEYMTLVADDANLLPTPAQSYSLELAPGQRLDAIIQPAATGVLSIHDRTGGLANGGMLAYLGVGTTVVPTVKEIGVFRAGKWYLDTNGNGAWNVGIDALYPTFPVDPVFGLAGDVPVAGDWDGNGTAEVGVFRNGRWYFDINGNRAWDAGIDTVYPSFGLTGDLPVAGNWDGVGGDQIGIFRNGRWYLDANGNGLWEPGIDTLYTSFGQAGDLPVAGDWDNDGITEIGVFRNGRWYLDTNGNGLWEPGIDTLYTSYGQTGDLPVAGDWDLDGISEIGFFRGGQWYLDTNGNGLLEVGIDTVHAAFGLAGDLPVAGDWDNDGISEIGVIRTGRWYLDTNGNGLWEPGIDAPSPIGLVGDLPVAGDWNADGISEVAVFRNGQWYLDTNGNGAWDPAIDTVYASFGLAGDLPVAGDWDGNRTTEIGVFRNGRWYLDTNGNGIWEVGVDTLYTSFGLAGDLPVVGDWDGNGTAEIGIFRNGRWYLDTNGNGIWEAGVDTLRTSFGLAGDLPFASDWDGNGTSDMGVFRNGRWYLDSNGNGAWEPGVDTLYTSFGLAGDLPVVGNWQ